MRGIADLERRLSKETDPSVGELVTRYGTNIERLQQDAQQGKINPTKALMAKMAINRIVAANAPKPPQGTIFQEQMTPPAPQGLPAVPMDPRMFQGMAGGGIVAMAGGGDVQRFQNTGLVQNQLLNLFESLPMYDPAKEMAGIPGAEMFSSVSRFFNKNRRIDPVTGKPVTFAEFMRLQDQRSAAERTPSGLSAIAPVQPIASDTGMPSPSGLTTMTPDRIRQAEMLTDPTGGLTNKRMQDEAARAEALKAAGEKPAPAPAKEKLAAAPALSGAPDFFSTASKIKSQVTLAAADDEKKSYADVNQEMRDELTKAGYDFNLIKDQLAERRKDIEKLEGGKKEAANMRLLEAGLAILGGESPYAFVNIGKGASKAMQGFQDDIKEIAKNRRELDKDLRQLQTLGNNEALMMTAEGRKRYDAIQKRAEDRERDETKLQYDVAREVFRAENDRYLTGLNLESRERTFNIPSDTMRFFNMATEGMTPEQKKEAAKGVISRGGSKPDVLTKDQLLTSWSSIEKDPGTFNRYTQMGITTFPEYEQYIRTKMTPIDIEALKYVRDNPNDPKSAQILQKLGVK